MTYTPEFAAKSRCVRLETPRLIVREHRLEDLIPLHVILTDPAATWYIPSMRKESEGETEAYLRGVMRDAERPIRLRYNLVIEEKDTGALLGSVGLHRIDGTSEGAHYGLGYFLRPDRWNRGFTTEAARAALGFLFGGNACRVSASCLAENLGSRRVAEKCGMTQEALLKSHTWHDGQWKDCAVYRVFREDYLF